MKLSRTDTYKIHSYDCDLKGKLYLPILTRFLQETAWAHSEDMGIGYSDLLKNNRTWVLYKQVIQIEKWPRWGEIITIKTAPSGADKLFCYREFELSVADEIIGRISSSWLVINTISRRPVRTKDFYSQDLAYPMEIYFPDLIKGKMRWVPETIETHEIAVELLDIDINQHVNNACYPSWCLNFYTPEFIQNHTLYSIEQQFIAEAMFKDNLLVSRTKADDLEDQFTIFRAGKEIFKLCLKWR